MPTVLEKKCLNKLFSLQSQGMVLYSKTNKKYSIRNYDTSDGKVNVTLVHGYGLNEETEKIIFDLENFVTELIELSPIGKNIETKAVMAEEKLSDGEKTGDNIKELRTHLFSALRKLEGGTMDANEGKAVASVAQAILNSAKLELDYRLQLGIKNKEIKMLES